MNERDASQPPGELVLKLFEDEPVRPVRRSPPPPPPPPRRSGFEPGRFDGVLDRLPTVLTHLLIFLVPLCSSDPRSLSASLLQVFAVAAGLLYLWRRPWPALDSGERVLLGTGLVLVMGPGLLSWMGSAEMLRATTEVRAWSAWLLLFVAVALAPGATRRWPGLLWLPALLALVTFQLGIGYLWWGTGGPRAARLLLGPSLAVALFGARGSGSRWVRLPQVLAAVGIAYLLLAWQAIPEMFTFFLVALMVAPRRKTLAVTVLLVVAWWGLATPHAWLQGERAPIPALGELQARAAARAPQSLFRPEREYGWSALRVARESLPHGAGPGLEVPLLVRRPQEPNLYAVPGAFLWEGIVALGWGFFLVLAGFLLLQMLADTHQEGTRETRAARGLLLGLWLPAFFLPLSGFLASPAWWIGLGLLAALRTEAPGHGYPHRERLAVRAAGVVLALLVCVPLARQAAAHLAFPHPDRVDRITADDVGRLTWAARLEPGNGAYRFALAHAAYAANLKAAGGKSYEAVNAAVLDGLRTATEKEPYNGVYRWVYSRFLLLAGRWDEALAQQSRAIALAPGRLEYRRSMAETCENLGRLMLALEEYCACADLDPFDPSLRLSIARVLVALHHPELAKAEYLKVLRLDPGNELAMRRLLRQQGAADLGVY